MSFIMVGFTNRPQNMLFFILLFSLVIFTDTLKAQHFEVMREVAIPAYTCVSQDRKGNVFLGDAEGVVRRLDSLGKEDLVFAPPQVAEVSQLEAQAGLRIFVFYREPQCYTFLNRFLTEKSQYCLNTPEIGFVQVMALGADNNFWIFDNSRFTLKKYNPQADVLMLDTPLDLVLDPSNYAITQMREYQNRLYLLNEKKEILIFDNLGNYQQTLVAKDWLFFNFFKESIFTVIDNQLIISDLYKNKQQSIALPSGQNWQFALALKQDEWIGFTKEKMYWLKWVE